MKKSWPILPLTVFSIGDRRTVPMFRQLYRELRAGILDGRLRPGTRLPPTRELAAELGVSRNTVLGAYDELFAEGYIEGAKGSGTFVSRTLPDDMLKSAGVKSQAGTPREIHNLLSKRGLAMTAVLPEIGERFSGRTMPFRSSTPDVTAFPFDIWTRLLTKHSRQPSSDLLSSAYPAGLPRLREAIAQYLRSSRAVKCEAEQVIVVSGGQMSLDIVAQMLLEPTDTIITEDPGYFGMWGVAARAGLNIISVPVDDEGISISSIREKGDGARLVYTTPSSQYPLGVTMSLSRRLELLEWARANDAWIIEDDYDGEFRYTGRPIPSLQGLDSDGRVIYMGTFSKVMFPGLRIGYLIAPQGLSDAFTKGKMLADLTSPTIMHAVLADFIEDGHFDRHLRRMRKLYAARQACLNDEAKTLLSGLLDVRPQDAGMHLIGWLPEGVDDGAVAAAAWERSVSVGTLSASCRIPLKRGGLVMGYTAFNERQIRASVKDLRSALIEILGG